MICGYPQTSAREGTAMSLNSTLNFFGHGMAGGRSVSDKTPIIASMFVGFVGSLCCGGGLVFGAIGLGAAYSALGVARFIPQALAAGAIVIALLNWLYYARKAEVALSTGVNCDFKSLRRTALASAFLALAMMAVSFLILEWLNHSVVRGGHSAHSPEFSVALIPGVPDIHLFYITLTFLVLPILAMLPIPLHIKSG
jgi:hypothetical protein